MSMLWHLVRYEYRMSTRRAGMWIVFALLALFYIFASSSRTDVGPASSLTTAEWWAYVGQWAFTLNLFLPVVGGILAADRMQRDERLGVIELLQSTPLDRWTYILGKYFGTLFSILTPVLALVILLVGLSVVYGAPPALFAMGLGAFLLINVPAYAFITIFSLGCPLIMPVRIYQVLFTGYWFWGNFLNPDFLPTLAGTLLTPCGKYAMNAFFNATVGVDAPTHTALEAILNLALLADCILLAMVALERLLARRASRA